MGFFDAIGREIKYLRGAFRMLGSIKDVMPDSSNLVPDDLEKLVDKHSANLAFLDGQTEWSYADFEAYANRVAQWALSQSCRAGDTVAVFVQNRLEYVAIWFGLSKIGVIPALLNFQLTGPALAHCLNISEARHAIIDAELLAAWHAAQGELSSHIKPWAAYGDIGDMDSFDAALERASSERPERQHRDGIVAGDQCMKMFTSGTTGLPKAAKVTHVRCQNYMRGFAAAAQTGPQDRMLMVLPLYHATGGLCGVGTALTHGGAVIVRRKFSASRFWDEAVEFKATLFMYVGELCRFLLAAEPSENETRHKIEWIIGNGLRPDVWPEFVERFNIPHVIEFYGATEGNVSLINVDGPVGAVGRIPGYLKSRFNADIIRYDVDSGVNPRAMDGFCIPCGPNEIGELIGEIRPDDGRFRFDGYEKKSATEKKILHNVFKKGDAWFRTGDLMKKDELGYYYFIDRVGDTFRWKAENVATGEVAAALSRFDGITQANVYGVDVPGYDGRAGMAAIVCDGLPDLAEVRAHLERTLPHYARPVFLRLSRETDTTSTFKFKKTNLVNAGFDPSKIHEPVYVYDSTRNAYMRIDKKLYKQIVDGEFKL